MLSITSVHCFVSRIADRILETWVPIARCTPEQSRQSKTPRLIDAQFTEFGSAQPQSAQSSFPGFFRNAVITRFCSAVSSADDSRPPAICALRPSEIACCTESINSFMSSRFCACSSSDSCGAEIVILFG